MYYKKREKQYFYLDKTGWTHRSIASNQHILEFDRVSCSSFSTKGGTFMTQQDEWQALVREPRSVNWNCLHR
jgi:hypothetical protein